jgi:hypothetical protein
MMELLFSSLVMEFSHWNNIEEMPALGLRVADGK